MQTIKLQQRGILTLPKKLRELLDLSEGQQLRVVAEDGKIILEPETTIDTQLAADLRKGLEDIKAGRFIEFSNLEEFDEKMKWHDD